MTDNNSKIVTFSGKYIDPLDLKTKDIVIEDIAHALSNQCRFSGHTQVFYCVAQHSLMVSSLLPEDLKLWGLLHDSNEGYLVDLPTPLKYDPYFGQTFRGAQKRALKVIAEAFDLEWPEPPEVKTADRIALATEVRDLMPQRKEWKSTRGIMADPVKIRPMTPSNAEIAFLGKYKELTNDR